MIHIEDLTDVTPAIEEDEEGDEGDEDDEDDEDGGGDAKRWRKLYIEESCLLIKVV